MYAYYQKYEIFLIQNYYLSKGIDWCCKQLPNRSRKSIINKASKLNCSEKIKNRQWKRYGDVVVLSRAKDVKSSCGMIRTQWNSLCLRCGKEFIVLGGNLQSGQKSCGHCNDIVIGKRYNDWIEPLKRVKNYKSSSGVQFSRYEVKCHYNGKGCKNTFFTLAASIKSGNTTSCGCLRGEQLRIRNLEKKPEDHYNWQGGITKFSHSIRTCNRNTEWRDFCRKRDNYTCQKCGKRGGGELPVHHFQIAFHKILEELTAMGITDLKDIPDDSEFWDTNNGITLCEDCHKEFHSIYGNDFTAEDFKIWFLAIIPEFAEELRCG